MKVALETVERELSRLWQDEARTSQAARVEVMTLVVLVSEPALIDRARAVIDEIVRAQPLRTIVAVWRDGDAPSIAADVALHRTARGSARGDAISLEAVGAARRWLPENIDRLALTDLPLCVWWVGDLPDFDDLFDRMTVGANLLVVNSGEMDLRDLEKLSSIAARSRDRYALTDLTWIRLRALQDLVARFFDDASARSCIESIDRITIEFAPRDGERDVASTQAGLLFGWMAHALSLDAGGAQWRRGEGWAEVSIGRVTARFEARARGDVSSGAISRVDIECGGRARFSVQRQSDPCVFLWSREAPGAPPQRQMLHVTMREEATLLLRCLEDPKRDRLLETSLHAAARIVRPVAPRLSQPPKG